MRQCSGSEHHAEHDAEEVVACDVARSVILAGERLGVRARRTGPGRQPLVLVPLCLGRVCILGIGSKRFLCSRHFLRRRVVGLQLPDVLLEISLALRIAGGRILQSGIGRICAGLHDAANFKFLRVVRELLFLLGHFLQHLTVGDLRDWVARVLHRQPDHGGQVGNDQDDVLGHLRPSHRAHPAKERAHEDAAQADEHAGPELESRKAAGDQPDAVDLRHHVGERAQDRGEDAHAAHDVTAVALAEEVGNRELAELAQVGREEQRHQHIAARPAHHECKAVKAGQVQGTRHADERRRAHPVRARRHAVEERRYAPAGHVVFRGVDRAAHDADAGVQRDGGEQEPVADPSTRHPHLLSDREERQEHQEPAGVPGVVLLQLGFECLVTHDLGVHSSSPSCTPYSMSSLFMKCW